MFIPETKEQYPEHSEYFGNLEDFQIELQKRFKKRLVSKKERPERLLGHNASVLLQKLITRSIYLLRGFVSSFNEGNAIMSFLAVRSHLETTGAVACLLKWLKKLYDNKCSYDEMDKTLYKLSLGGIVFPDKNLSKYSHVPNPFNALSLIDDVDYIYNKMGGEKTKPFRKSYKFLSEFCHPNFLSISQGSEVTIPPGIFEFNDSPNINSFEATELLSNLSVSLSMFIYLFDKCYNLLREHEELPDLID